MNKVASFVFAVLISSAGCQKSADLGRIQQETLATVKTFNNQLEIEQRRVDALLARGRQVAQAPGVGDAGKLLTQARASLEQLRGKASSAPQDLAAAAKQSREELDKTGDELIAQLDRGLALVKADLDAIDNWVSSSERSSAPTGGQATEQTTPGQPSQGNPPAAIQGAAGQNAPAAPGTGNTPAAPMDAPKANAGTGAVPATSPSATGQPGAANSANPNKK